MTDIAESLAPQPLLAKLSRRKTAQLRRTEHEETRRLVQKRCSSFSVGSPILVPESVPSISPVSTVAVRVIGNDEVSGSIPLPGTMKTTARGSLSEAEVMLQLARLGASVFTPAIGHDHPFDLVAHWDGHLSRVQVKTMRDDDKG